MTLVKCTCRDQQAHACDGTRLKPTASVPLGPRGTGSDPHRSLTAGTHLPSSPSTHPLTPMYKGSLSLQHQHVTRHRLTRPLSAPGAAPGPSAQAGGAHCSSSALPCPRVPTQTPSASKHSQEPPRQGSAVNLANFPPSRLW